MLYRTVDTNFPCKKLESAWNETNDQVNATPRTIVQCNYDVSTTDDDTLAEMKEAIAATQRIDEDQRRFESFATTREAAKHAASKSDGTLQPSCDWLAYEDESNYRLSSRARARIHDKLT